MAKEIRRAFRESGLSMKRLAVESDTRYASIHGFFATETRDAALSTVERWCEVLKLELRPMRRKGK